MFKKLFSIFQKNTLLMRAYENSYQMLDITKEMYLTARKSLREPDTRHIDIDIRSRDLEINKYEREVRRQVFNHLAVSGTSNLHSALVLISIIIDIERIGDYTKNMIELAENHPGKLQEGIFAEDLHKVETAVEDAFNRVRNFFEKTDQEDARKLLQEYNWVNPICDQRVLDYLKEKDTTLSRGDCVAMALYFRYLKRINSHLRNITTSIVNPFDRIGFVPKEFKGKRKQ